VVHRVIGQAAPDQQGKRQDGGPDQQRDAPAIPPQLIVVEPQAEQERDQSADRKGNHLARILPA